MTQSFRAPILPLIVSTLAFAGLVAACGGAQTAAPAEPTASSESEPKSDAAAAEGSEKKSDEKADAKGDEKTAEKPAESPPAPSDGPTLKRTPLDIVTAPDTLFVLDFNASEPGEKADAQCESKFKDDPKSKNQCMKQARSKVLLDAIQFVKDDQGRWHYIPSRMTGNTLTPIEKPSFEPGVETETTVKLNLNSKPPRTITIETPSEHAIILLDPVHGKLKYTAKVGVLGE